MSRSSLNSFSSKMAKNQSSTLATRTPTLNCSNGSTSTVRLSCSWVTKSRKKWNQLLLKHGLTFRRLTWLPTQQTTFASRKKETFVSFRSSNKHLVTKCLTMFSHRLDSSLWRRLSEELDSVSWNWMLVRSLNLQGFLASQMNSRWLSCLTQENESDSLSMKAPSQQWISAGP